MNDLINEKKLITMKFTVFSDLHVHNYKKYDIASSRLDNTLNVLNDIFEYNNRNEIDLILFPGDLYNQQKSLPTIVVNRTIGRLSTLFKKYPTQKIIAISGNHDHATKNLLSQPSQTALLHLSEVFEKRFIILDNKVENYNDNLRLFGIPYYEYKEHFISQLALLSFERDVTDYKGIKILMIHQTPEHSNPIIPFDFKPNDKLFDAFDLVLCGHIHTKEKLTSNFWLVGSPLHRDLGDEGQNKGFLVFDTKDLDKPKFIHLDKYPKFKRSNNVQDIEGNDYVVPIVEFNDDRIADVDFEKFTTNNDRKTLLTNYWEAADGKDKGILQLGLKFVL